jgi:hypothetical protein
LDVPREDEPQLGCQFLRVKIVPKMHDYVLVVFKGKATFVEERHESKKGLEPLNDGMVDFLEV